MKRKTWITAALALVLACTAACALADSWTGTTAAGETAHVTAPADGLLLSLSMQAGGTAEAGETVGEIRTEKVFAPFDGTVVSVAAKEGEKSEGAVLEISPTSLYAISCTVSNVAETMEDALVHVGEKLYVRCSADGSHRAEAVVTAVDGAQFSAETTAGELYIGEAVMLYRRADYTGRVGKGTVTVHETITLEAEGTVLNLRVQPGDSVERGQWLYSLSTSAESGITVRAGGIVTAVNAKTGDSVREGQELAEIATSVAIRIEIDADDVKQFRRGAACTYTRGDDPHETPYPCTAARILLGETDTTAVVELIPEGDTLLPIGMTVLVMTD